MCLATYPIVQDELDIQFNLTSIDHNLFAGRFVWSMRLTGDYHSKNIGDVSRVVHAVLEEDMSTQGVAMRKVPPGGHWKDSKGVRCVAGCIQLGLTSLKF